MTYQPPRQAWPPRDQFVPPPTRPVPVQQPAARPVRAVRRRRPYPSHLTRFPWGLLPHGGRRRGHGTGSWLYLGRHWLVALATFYVYLAIVAVIAAWALLVITGWALWVAVVTLLWACGLARGSA